MNNLKMLLTLSLACVMMMVTSCKEKDAQPQPEPIIIEKELNFIEGLELFYYGKKINIWDEAHRIVGPNGKVDYEIFQPAEFDGTDFVTVTYNLNADDTAKFTNLNFVILVDMNQQSVDEILEAYKDGETLTATNLILMLGDW
ncbi:hypothetical protein QQ008_02360 [Fulvivirgaceae bacterium BMA10]|uniref:Uncharacterized protein n=1 Tax=Splendidivirga corallicola TaxID=3051826 RepID=A0ABT8KHI0_9BACT|nr:hypothetical protein [Fulvivirgaceae bacterium BMA10]